MFVMFNCVFVTFPCGILGKVWYLIVSIPDLFRFSYFDDADTKYQETKDVCPFITNCVTEFEAIFRGLIS